MSFERRSALSSPCFVVSPVICLHSEQNRQLPEKDLAVVRELSRMTLAWIPLQQGSIDGLVGSCRSTKNINSQGNDINKIIIEMW